jgi:GH15 family glucan-1,4-alpha-glucosidase
MTHLRLRDLALIGDRRTAALLTRHGDVVWYCPGRFDRPSLFAALLDSELGGSSWPAPSPAEDGTWRTAPCWKRSLKPPTAPLC